MVTMANCKRAAGKLGAPVCDIVPMPGGANDLMVLGGRAPQRANDRGSVFVRDPLAETNDRMEMPLRALGMVWISDAGGWSEIPA